MLTKRMLLKFIFFKKELIFSFLYQKLILKKFFFNSCCFYTKRYRSIFMKYKMSRYVLKSFLDNVIIMDFKV